MPQNDVPRTNSLLQDKKLYKLKKQLNIEIPQDDPKGERVSIINADIDLD